MRYAVFDLGSNSVKLLVAEKRGRQLHIVEESSHVTRLAENSSATGTLGKEAMKRTVKWLGKLRKKATELGVEKMCAVATSAVRESKNRKEFLKEGGKALGVRIELLSGEEEAALVFRAVTGNPRWRQRALMVMDVGGGSVEWIEGRDSKIIRKISLPLGVVRLKERFIARYPLREKKIYTMMRILEEQLAPHLDTFKTENSFLICTGGTATTLALMKQRFVKYDPEKVEGAVIKRIELEDWIKKLSGLKLAQLKKIPGLSPKRADLILPGIILYAVTLKLLHFEKITVSRCGLRHGVLQQMISA